MILHAKTAADLSDLVKLHGLGKAVHGLIETVGNREKFDREYLPVLENLADRVQGLPLQKTVFNELGGALECAVLSANLAIRMCAKTIFAPTATAAERRDNEPSYRWLVFCSVVANVYLTVCSQMDIHDDGDPSGNTIYSWSDDTPLRTWCQGFSVTWIERPQPNPTRMMMYAAPIFFPGQFAHLSRQLVEEFGSSINPAMVTSTAETPIGRVVREAISAVIEHERKRMDHWLRQTDAVTSPPKASIDVAEIATVVLGDDAIRGGAEKKAPHAAASPAGGNGEDKAPPALEKALTTSGVSSQADKPAVKTEAEELPAVRKASGFLAAIAMAATCDEGVQVSDAGDSMTITAKVMRFGGTASDNYKILFDAKFVLTKGERSVVLNQLAVNKYLAAKAKRP